ncbi:MAG: hypothetical protein HOU81_15685 [Hamadaea sp.]|uniref:hypothetical protein n=1 Tax=Hamadaea sp. TaxID=2024425 RepID=UPI001809AE87|nr:hypothetical protein [Hamadaea sp.]NUR72254.1 hypothetical protein [Hamadaea sp.]NUT17685.1 hypothetical protein [Hamadaea sp.]
MTTPEPASRSRLLLWIGLPLVVVLLSCLGAGAGALLARRDARSGEPTGLDVTTTPSSSTSPSARSTRSVVIRLPKTLLGRAKTTDKTLLDSAEKAAATQRAAEATTSQVLATYYGTFAKKNLVFVLAVQGDVVDPDHLFATVTAALESQRKGLKLVEIAPGPLGGRAACGDSTVSGGTVAECVWVDSGSYAFVEFFGVKATTVKDQFALARGQLETAN